MTSKQKKMMEELLEYDIDHRWLLFKLLNNPELTNAEDDKLLLLYDEVIGYGVER